MKQVLRKTFFKMERNNKDTFYWLHKQSKENEGMCCSLNEFVQSPILESYRNKCEFTIGYDSTETSKFDYSFFNIFSVIRSCLFHYPLSSNWMVKVIKNGYSDFKKY